MAKNRIPLVWVAERPSAESAGALHRVLRRLVHRWSLPAVLGIAAGAIWLTATRGRAPAAEAAAANLEDVAEGVDGADAIWIRHLGHGIYELVGHAPHPEAAREIANELADRPGVVAVVNRVWVSSAVDV